MRRYYKYCVMGRERNKDTGIHPISIHITFLGAMIGYIFALQDFKDVYLIK